MIGEGFMSAPIVEQGATTRTVYFPGDTWFNFITGEEHKAGSIGTITNQLTDVAPIFVRNGWMLPIQDTEHVTKTSQLTNKFHLVGGCKVVVDNATTVECVTKTGILSLGDYESNGDVDRCIREGCDYDILLTLRIDKESQEKELTLQTYLIGGMKNEQSITEMTFYVEGQGKVEFVPEEKIAIFQEGVQTFKF